MNPVSRASGLETLWQQWRAELQSKPVLRVGVLSILGILWLYAALVLGDVVKGQRLVLQSQQALYDELARDAQDERVFEWRQQMATTLEAYRELAVRDESEGLLQASFSDDIRRLLLAHELKVMDLTVDLLPTPEDTDWPTELRLIRARVTVVGRRDAVLRSWATLLEQRPGLWFESVKLGSGHNSAVEWEIAELCAIGPRTAPP